MIGHKYFGDLAKGGKLGNQLFEYAALYSVAKKNNYEFGFSEDQIQYFRKCFLFRSAKILTNEDYKTAASSMDCRVEAPPKDLEALNTADNTLFDGYFQSEQYFEHVKDDLRAELCYNPNQTTLSERFIRQLKSAPGRPPDINTVSVHYRRGDYIQNEFPCLPIEYYINCFSQFEPTNTIFIICSDELQTAKKVFNTLNAISGNRYTIIFSPFSEDVGPEFWDVQEDQVNAKAAWNPAIDMGILSLSDHCIIANSSLSWWGSWFYDHPDKRILAPPIWFKGTKTKESAICREKWEIVEY